MIRQGYKRVFQTNPENLQEMISLRKLGWSFAALGRKFEVHHTSIMWWCRKLGIVPSPGKSVEVRATGVRVEHRLVLGNMENKPIGGDKDKPYYEEPINPGFPQFGVERINKGHNYRYYLSIDRFKNLSKAGKLLYAQRNITGK